MQAETIPLGCPDCGAKWPDEVGPIAQLDGKRYDCPACGRGYTIYVVVTLNMVRH